MSKINSLVGFEIKEHPVLASVSAVVARVSKIYVYIRYIYIYIYIYI